MLNEQEKIVLMRGYQMVRNVWVVSVILLVVLVLFSRVQIDAEKTMLSRSQEVIRLVFTGISFLIALLTVVLRKILIKRTRILRTSNADRPMNTIVFRQTLVNYRSAILVSSQLSLGMAVPGILLAVMGHGSAYLYGFSIAAFLLLLIYRPRISEFQLLFVRLKNILSDLRGQ